ncbi:MAG: hypothetical protein U5L45_07020 [Saprospiraceae bacterium]|nr:hypothetical protein [Saprospiraceae bacterium]
MVHFSGKARKMNHFSHMRGGICQLVSTRRFLNLYGLWNQIHRAFLRLYAAHGEKKEEK